MPDLQSPVFRALQFNEGPHMLVALKMDGTVEFGPDYTPAALSKVLREWVTRPSPEALRIEELEGYVRTLLAQLDSMQAAMASILNTLRGGSA